MATYLHIPYIQGGLRRVGLTPALAPRMPVITEDVLYIVIIGKNRRCKCDSTAKGYNENKSCLNEENEKLESDAMNHSNKFCHPAHDDEWQQQAAAAASAAATAV